MSKRKDKRLVEGQKINFPVCLPCLHPKYTGGFGQALELAQDYRVKIHYTDGTYSEFSAPSHFEFDASIPQLMIARRLVGSPFDPKFWAAASIHDLLYQTHFTTREEADRVFLELLRLCNVDTAWLMYKAVRVFGDFPLKSPWEITKADAEYTQYLDNYLDAYRSTTLDAYRPVLNIPTVGIV